jgi:putative ABC transport system permease protein
METFWQDLRFAWRTLLRNPGFSFVALFTLVLGIAATTSVATVASAVLLHDLPYPQPDRLLLLENFKDEKGSLETYPSSYLDYKDWKTKTTAFEEIGVHSYSLAFNLLGVGDPERVNGEVVDSSYFRLLRVQPLLGRALTPQDDAKPGEPRVVVLSHALWQRRFGGDLGVIGKSMIIDGESYQIVGVMPARFQGLTDEAEIWLPLTMGNEILGNSRFLNIRGVRWLIAVGRLKPGVTLAQAQHEMDAINSTLEKEFPSTNEHMVVHMKTLEQSLFGDLRFPLLTLLGASLFVLLIAWTTVANLLLARATARQREIAVRDALGATRFRLLRQLLTESLLLAGLSCALGLLVARWATRVLVAASSIKFQSFVDLGLNPLVVTAIVALSLLCGIGFGLAPAWLGLRESAGALREGSSSTGAARHRFQSSLVVAEVALALFLLIGAGLLIKGFQRSRQADLGFRPDNLLTIRVDLKGKRYSDTKVMTSLARQYRERLQAIPGVKAVSVEGPVMPTDGWFGNSFIVEDLLQKTKDGIAFMVFHHVSPGYFQNLGIPLLEGRDFTEADTDKSQLVIILNQAAKKKYWPNESPLGKRMKFGRLDPNAPWFTVVGVVADINQNAIQELEWPGPDAYFAVQQFPPLIIPRLTFLIRPQGVPPLSLVPQVQRELKAAAPDLPSYDPDTMAHRLEQFTAKGRFLVLLMSLFAGLALVLAASGLYGVLFYSVTQRTRELGIRVALGAQSRDLFGLVVGRAAALAGIGLVIGLVGAVFLNRLFQSLLYGVSPTDLLTFLGTSVLLFLVAMFATYFPARRAMRVQPTTALRTE